MIALNFQASSSKNPELQIMGVADHMILCAEFPDPNEVNTKDVYELVKKHMIHGSCGEVNPLSPSMTDGKCTKRFPKDFTPVIQVGNDSYPQYRRRNPHDGGHTTTLRIDNVEVQVDNRHVVPHNPWLLKKYHAHINEENCASIKAVKYLLKYVHKGSE